MVDKVIYSNIVALENGTLHLAIILSLLLV